MTHELDDDRRIQIRIDACMRTEQIYASVEDDVDPEGERQRLHNLSCRVLDSALPEYAKLSEDYDPHAVVTAIHEAGHASSYLWQNPSGKGCSLFLHMNEYNCYTGRNEHQHPFIPETAKDFWWFCFNKMAGVGAEKYVLGHEFDGCSGSQDTFQLLAFLGEASVLGFSFYDTSGNTVSREIIRDMAIEASNLSMKQNSQIHLEITKALLENSPMDLASYVSEKHSGQVDFHALKPKSLNLTE